jgi:streptogramin lyase
MMFQPTVAGLDLRTAKFHICSLPPELNDNVAQLDMLSLHYAAYGTNDIGRLDAQTGKVEFYETPLSTRAVPAGDGVAKPPVDWRIPGQPDCHAAHQDRQVH